MSDWSKAKARQVIDHQIALASASLAPDSEYCDGMIQLAYALGLLTNQELEELSNQLRDTVTGRRKQLRESQNAALLGLEVTRA